MIPWWWVPIIVLMDNSFVGRFIRRLGTRSGEVVSDWLYSKLRRKNDSPSDTYKPSR